MNTTKLFTLTISLLLIGACSNQKTRTGANETTENSSGQYKIFMDITHDQIFWNDPAGMQGHDASMVERVNYMTSEFEKNATSLNADLMYLRPLVHPHTCG